VSGVRCPLGKIAPGQFERVIAPHLGAVRSEVLVGPRAGQDSAIVKLGGGRVLAVTTDPLSVVPALGFEASARLSCHLIASDLWTTGIAPAWGSITFNLPPQMGDAELEAYWLAMSDEWARLGVSVVTGHTGRYAGCDYSIIGAGTLMGVGDESSYLTPAMALPGDRVIVTKGCAVEATAIAAWLFPGRLGARLDAAGVARARALLGQVSVVADCRAVLSVGVRERGVTALHDATEGGVLGGLLELARACGHDLAVERARIPLSLEARAACQVFGTDPYWTLSEGTLIATAPPAHAAGVLAALAAVEIPAAEVGEIVPGCGRLRLEETDGALMFLTEPEPDPYWPAYQRALAEGWE
jgi:hydrogenase expression/formation protein HypE